MNAKKYWYKELIDGAGEETDLLSCIMLVGNKVDLEASSAKDCVTEADLKSAARELGISQDSVIRTSAKTGENVHTAFTSLIRRIHVQEEMRKQKARGADMHFGRNSGGEGVALSEMKYAGDDDGTKKGCCK